MINHWFDSQETVGVLIGIFVGISARFVMLRTDYRQYPTYPHGRLIHLSLGVIAAGMGSVAVPSLLGKDYTAVTFLALAAQQFREVRNMERETLSKIDSMELVPRGATYIEGIAMVFEGRNYLVIFSSLASTLCAILFSWYWGAIAGIIALFLCVYLKSGSSLNKIADVELAKVHMDGPNLYVGNIYIMNVGLEESRSIIKRNGMGLILTPKNRDVRATLANPGQRQALLHDLSTVMGVYHDMGDPSLIPMAKLDLSDGRLAVFIIPTEGNPDRAAKVAMRVPLLESAVKMPSEG